MIIGARVFSAMHPTAAGPHRERDLGETLAGALRRVSEPVRGSELRYRAGGKRRVIARGAPVGADGQEIGWVFTEEGEAMLCARGLALFCDDAREGRTAAR